MNASSPCATREAQWSASTGRHDSWCSWRGASSLRLWRRRKRRPRPRSRAIASSAGPARSRRRATNRPSLPPAFGLSARRSSRSRRPRWWCSPACRRASAAAATIFSESPDPRRGATMSNIRSASGIDPVLTAVIANRIDGIVREMTNTLLRAARSAVISSARDFSCGICTADNQLLACVEGLPIHIFRVHEQARAMTTAHPLLAEGDAFLHNDPYTGNTHPADHTFLVPVFVDGEHLFTAVAKAHQADIGNSIPSTYHAGAKDVYEEGALIFPAVRIQRDYRMIDDVVRMARSRIRVADQWYGDFLAGLGAARIGERRPKGLCLQVGHAMVQGFVSDWLDYSEQRMSAAISRLPPAHLVNDGRHDPFQPMLSHGIPIHVDITIDTQAARATVDLRGNVDNVEAGLNLSEACTVSAVLTGVVNSFDPDIP